ncbi:transmembrane protein 14 homolog, partial [Drosophila serrata]|uniref:transmembrane protein 14 homolog n=1 Tax=Drosophila serrata TaxID=7274 RepID=UPI000A1D0A3C
QNWFGYVYAAAVAAKAGSIPTLGAGLAFGALLGSGAHLNSQDTPRPLLQLETSLFLAGLMGLRWNRSGSYIYTTFRILLANTAPKTFTRHWQNGKTKLFFGAVQGRCL